MRLAILSSALLLPLALAKGVLISHFDITTPSSTSPWVSGKTNSLAWDYSKTSVLQFDIELVRLSATGLLLVAKNVPIAAKKALIDVEGIPEGDDYFAIFMDSYDGSVYARSSKFSILSNNTASTTVADVTISMAVTGTPNPLRVFETEFPALQATTSATTAAIAGNVGAYAIHHQQTTTPTATPTPLPRAWGNRV